MYQASTCVIKKRNKYILYTGLINLGRPTLSEKKKEKKSESHCLSFLHVTLLLLKKRRFWCDKKKRRFYSHFQSKLCKFHTNI